MNPKLSQLFRQLGDIWKNLGLNQRINIVLAAAVVMIGLGALSYYSSRADFALLYGKLDEGEASKVVAALDAAKIQYQFGQGGSAIYVPSDKVYAMRMQLAGKGIPKGEGVGFEIFDKANFGISDFVQRANWLRAVQGELARTIGQLDTVTAARVMIVMPENRLLVDNQKHPTASVFLQLRGSSLPAEAVSAIRFLVANSVEGLQPNFVSVVDNHGNVLSDNDDNNSFAGMTAGQLTVRKNMEQYLSKKAESMLEKVLGPGQAVVRVAAEINSDSITRTEEKFDPENAVLRSSTINDENNDTLNGAAGGGGAGGGVPGMSTNSSTQTNVVSSVPTNSTQMRKKTTTTQYEINKITSSTVLAPGGLRRVSAAVFIAARMEGTGDNRKVTPRTPEELEKLRRIVQSAIGLQTAEDALIKGEVTLEEMQFNNQLGQDLTTQLTSQKQYETYKDIGLNLLYLLTAVGFLFAFWRGFQRMPAEEIPIGVPLRRMNGNGNGGGNAGPEWNPEQAQRLVSVDALNQLVRENPANMTQAIRAWMNRGGAKTN